MILVAHGEEPPEPAREKTIRRPGERARAHNAAMKTRFTPAEANRTLPLVKRIVADILERGRDLRAAVESAGGDPGYEDERRITRIENELRELMRELENIGCYYKDWGFEMGLVDFPAQIDGQDVFLCWRSDEDKVEWYHTHEAGYAGRQPIPEDA